ncbi:MAG: tetratricopeptide repeat protein [Elusimicrobiaceae bacterium]|nr:tetratricopeptide repeat protein [Elusimicrobiaceae bacterium]
MKKLITLTLFLFCLAPLFAQSADTELEFYKSEINAADKKQLSSLEWDLNSWLERNYSLPSAADAMLYKAKVEYLNKQYAPAYLTLLKYVYEFPTKKMPKDLARQIVVEFPTKQQTELMQALTPGNLPQATEDRLNMFFTTANKLNLKDSNEHLLKDYSMFFTRFPGYENRDKIELLLGDSYRNDGNYLAALSKYDKVWKIYPSTKYKAASLRMKGDIYASELKDFEKAKDYYNKVLNDFPNSVEIPTVYKHLALLEADTKNYEVAMDEAQKAYEGYLKDGQKLEAYNALMLKAEVQEKNLKNYTAAVKTLKVAAELMPAEERYYVQAKQKEAQIQAKKLKDNYSERTVMEEIAAHFPTTENGVQALYRAAELAEKFGDAEKAKNQYKQVILNRPQSKAAVKAQKRITKIEKAALKSAKNSEK